jgi:hypothetical protein
MHSRSFKLTHTIKRAISLSKRSLRKSEAAR